MTRYIVALSLLALACGGTAPSGSITTVKVPCTKQSDGSYLAIYNLSSFDPTKGDYATFLLCNPKIVCPDGQDCSEAKIVDGPALGPAPECTGSASLPVLEPGRITAICGGTNFAHWTLDDPRHVSEIYAESVFFQIEF